MWSVVKTFFHQGDVGGVGAAGGEVVAVGEAFSGAETGRWFKNGLVRYPPVYSGISTRGDSLTGVRSRIQDILGIRSGRRMARAISISVHCEDKSKRNNV